MKILKGTYVILSDCESFNLAQDMELKIGDIFQQFNMNYKVTRIISNLMIEVEELSD